MKKQSKNAPTQIIALSFFDEYCNILFLFKPFVYFISAHYLKIGFNIKRRGNPYGLP